MSLEAKDARAKVTPHHPGIARPVRAGLRLLHALLLVALGGWLVVRALQTVWPNARLSMAMRFTGATGVAVATAALLLGGLLLVAATTLPMGRARAWAVAALGALAALALIVTAWAISGNSEWPGALLSMAAVVLLAAPSARELYLNEEAQP